ncbi:MAG: hypothetical protein N2445_02165 [Acidobacteria bacterium]|nr:hypothetical protein [Acidobacteriota bacterium]
MYHWFFLKRKIWKKKFFLEFSWTGTDDPTPFLIIPDVIKFWNSITAGGLKGIMSYNRTTCLKAREFILKSLEIEKPCPDEMVGSMASFPLPDAQIEPYPPLFIDSLQDKLFFDHKIEVPVMYFPKYPKRVLRISAQIYNTLEEYAKLAEILKVLI